MSDVQWNMQPRVASADVIQKFNPNNKNALIKQYKTIYHPGEVRTCLDSIASYKDAELCMFCCFNCSSKHTFFGQTAALPKTAGITVFQQPTTQYLDGNAYAQAVSFR